MISLHPIDTDRAAARRRHLASATAPSTIPISSLSATFDDVVSSDLSFEIDWFLAAVLMSTPAGAGDPAAE
jgi:hypothetical protein